MPEGPTLAFILGDQLDHESAVLARLNPARDVVLLAEVAEESRHVPSHVQRTVLFLSAMRHFARELAARGFRVRYTTLADPANTGTLAGELARAARELSPSRILLTEPGEWRLVLEARSWAGRLGIPVELIPDGHFYGAPGDFERWAEGRRELTMEYFYRAQRRAHRVLMDGEHPAGGAWNYDRENREPFGREGPPLTAPPPAFVPDDLTREVIGEVRTHLPDLPGSAEGFAWPVTRAQALEALASFIRSRLPTFGRHQDAMWQGEPFVSHSLLSAALNLKLLNPRECVRAAEEAYRAGRVPIASAEAFIRQVLGWREFIRGVYRLAGPGYADRNHLGHTDPLPPVYWTGRTRMVCMEQCVGEVLARAYGHHIQRLMVTGNFALLAGVHPAEVSAWYLGMYIDGVDWVTRPNVAGMALHADGGLVGTKPYAASGRYISRMSNYCRSCPYDPASREGERACPFTVLYWDFLLRHAGTLRGNRRMAVAVAQAARLPARARTAITISAAALRRKAQDGTL